MELIIILPMMFLFGVVISKQLNTNKADCKSSITRIDDKNWIVNNEFVSFEEDTPLKRFQQKQEDYKHYSAYETERLMRDRETIWNDLMKTKQAVAKFPDIKECVTEEKLNNITEKYEKYLNMCNKLNEGIFLTKEEFLIKEENVALCVDFSNMLWIRKPIGCYTIYNEKTAKYMNGNMSDLITSEFKEKWY